MKKYFYYLALLILFSANATADEKPFLTVTELVKNGFVRLTGQQISEIMNKNEIRVVDIETDAVSISQQGESDSAMERKFEETKSDKASYFLDSRLMARAPALQGKIQRKVTGDELVATDGMRTYNYSVYEKQGRMFAVRDIDNGNVFFEIEVR
jgi:hypothetical protein